MKHVNLKTLSVLCQACIIRFLLLGLVSCTHGEFANRPALLDGNQASEESKWSEVLADVPSNSEAVLHADSQALTKLSEKPIFEPPPAAVGKPESPTAATSEPKSVSQPPEVQFSVATRLPDNLLDDSRDQSILVKLTKTIRKLDKIHRAGRAFPLKTLERTLRAEFERRDRGETHVSWLGKRKLRFADKRIALDNLELLMSYTDHLSTAILQKGKQAISKAQFKELMMLAAKEVIDDCSLRGGIGSITVNTENSGSELSRTGKAEWKRRQRLVGHLVPAFGYRRIKASSMNDLATRYRKTIASSAAEYEKLASLIDHAKSARRGVAGENTKPKKRGSPYVKAKKSVAKKVARID